MPAIPPNAAPSAAHSEPPEYPSPRIVDSRRLMGPNLYSDSEGALLEVRLETRDDALLARLCHEWEHFVRLLSVWPGNVLAPQVRVDIMAELSAATLFLPAPVDVLMTATDVSEQGWLLAEARVEGSESGALHPSLLTRISDAVDAELAAHPHLELMQRAALSREFTFTFDDEFASVGSGSGSLTWPLLQLPHPSDIDWSTVHDVPIALVTGSNGKTTTTRLVAAMLRASGRVTGLCCSDGVWVSDEQLDAGDFSGPAGAREVLRDTRVEAAVLETARGGILRRGLAVHRATAAIITNIAADHFGEYGVHSLADLVAVKGVLARTIDGGGHLVLNADDPLLVAFAQHVSVPISLFSMAATNAVVEAHLDQGGNACVVREGKVLLRTHNAWHNLGEVRAMPLTLGGAAPHNIANILGACMLAAATGVPVQSIRATIAHFGAEVTDNPGRLQLYRFGGMTAVVDYAHNPDGLAALCSTAKALPAMRRLLVLGQAGNRDDDQLRALVRSAWSITHFERVIVKEMPSMLRGRPLGEVPAIFVDELRAVGMRASGIEVAPTEFDALRRAFAWASDGDVLVCPMHVEKRRILVWLAQLRDAKWTPGMTLPE